jgi:hypothetical protein
VTGLDGREFRPNGRATFTVVDTLSTCGWCRRRVDVVADGEAGHNRLIEHVRIGNRVKPCPGSGRPVGASPVTTLVDRLLGDR